jgi:hypothetical protein
MVRRDRDSLSEEGHWLGIGEGRLHIGRIVDV